MSVSVPNGYKQTMVGVIPKDWDTPRIDSVLKRVRRKVDVEKDTEYQEIGIRSHAKGLFHKEKITGKQLGNKAVFWVEEDCFIVNIVFAWEQAVAKTTDREKGMIASHRFPMYRPKDNKVDIDYILYFFKSKRGKHLLGLASPGGAGRNKTLGQSEFVELRIPLPSLQEQQKIVQIFTIWDDAIAKQDALIKAKEKLKKGLMQKLLSGELRFDGFSDKWEEVQLGERCVIKTGTTKSKFQDDNGLYFIVDMGSVSKEGKLIPTKRTNIKQDFLTMDDLIMPKDDIGGGQIIGRTARIDCDYKYVMGDHLYLLQCKKDNPAFIHYVINTESTNRSFRRKATGTAQLGLNKKSVETQTIICPGIEEQQKIAEVFILVDKEIDLLKNQFKALNEQKRGLMQKLLRGEVRVNI